MRNMVILLDILYRVAVFKHNALDAECMSQGRTRLGPAVQPTVCGHRTSQNRMFTEYKFKALAL